MARYVVGLRAGAYVEFEVEAENKDEAVDLAYKLADSNWDGEMDWDLEGFGEIV